MIFDSRTRIIALLSGKGGVGKTTIVANLGAQLAKAGERTLLIDADFYTRGMTFLMCSKVKYHEVGYVEVLDQLLRIEQVNEDRVGRIITPGTIQAIRPYLHILPPYSIGETHSIEVEKFEFNSKSVVERAAKSRSFIQSYFRDYKFVIFDCRSGTDSVSLAPVFFADEYWIVTEEDNTSIRATNFLLEQIDDYASFLNLGNYRKMFGGFIINMIVSSGPDVVASSLERIFDSRCLAVIPLSRRARETFIRDELISDIHPYNLVSREIDAVCRYLRKGEGEGESAVDRWKRRLRIDRLWRSVMFILLIATPMVAAGYVLAAYRQLEFSLPNEFLSIGYGMIGVAAGALATYLFVRRD